MIVPGLVGSLLQLCDDWSDSRMCLHACVSCFVLTLRGLLASPALEQNEKESVISSLLFQNWDCRCAAFAQPRGSHNQQPTKMETMQATACLNNEPRTSISRKQFGAEQTKLSQQSSAPGRMASPQEAHRADAKRKGGGCRIKGLLFGGKKRCFVTFVFRSEFIAGSSVRHVGSTSHHWHRLGYLFLLESERASEREREREMCVDNEPRTGRRNIPSPPGFKRIHTCIHTHTHTHARREMHW